MTKQGPPHTLLRWYDDRCTCYYAPLKYGFGTGVAALGRPPEMYDDVHEAVREAFADFENVVID